MSGARSIVAPIESRNWLSAYTWVLARRLTQALVVGAFLLGPWTGLWIVKGSMSSSLTLGLLPLTGVFGGNEGVELRAPMAITVICGLTFSTLLTLFVIPVIYSFSDRRV